MINIENANEGLIRLSCSLYDINKAFRVLTNHSELINESTMRTLLVFLKKNTATMMYPVDATEVIQKTRLVNTFNGNYSDRNYSVYFKKCEEKPRPNEESIRDFMERPQCEKKILKESGGKIIMPDLGSLFSAIDTAPYLGKMYEGSKDGKPTKSLLELIPEEKIVQFYRNGLKERWQQQGFSAITEMGR